MSEKKAGASKGKAEADVLDLETAIRKTVLPDDPRFPVGAYIFLYEALAFTQHKLGRAGEKLTPEQRHVTGQELLEGIRDFAMEQFGPLAPTVFKNWGIQSSRDFGDIVFNLVKHGLLGKTEEDQLSDFENGFDINSSFDGPFQVKLP